MNKREKPGLLQTHVMRACVSVCVWHCGCCVIIIICSKFVYLCHLQIHADKGANNQNIRALFCSWPAIDSTTGTVLTADSCIHLRNNCQVDWIDYCNQMMPLCKNISIFHHANPWWNKIWCIQFVCEKKHISFNVIYFFSFRSIVYSINECLLSLSLSVCVFYRQR